MNDLILNEL